MTTFRKKPVEIEAIQLTKHEGVQAAIQDWAQEFGVRIHVLPSGSLVIPTLEGDHTASVGDWIIKGVKNEFYPCKPDIFEATYEEVHKREFYDDPEDEDALKFTRGDTSRGFNFLSFRDRYDADCSLQQSSLALCEPPGSGAIWLGVDKTGEGKDVESGRMHLTYKQVPKLIEALEYWLEHGTFNGYET